MPKGKTVLIVDDSDILVSSLARVLRNHWDTACAYTVPQAVERIGRGGIDVILSDWDMPAGGGAVILEVAGAIGIPVVILSGGLDFPDGRQKQAAGLINKPADLVDIDRALWNALKIGQKSATIQ